MKIYRAFRTELDLNRAQRNACARHAGVARWAYNWGLARKKEAHLTKQKIPSAYDLQHELVLLKKTQLPWLYEVSIWASSAALVNLDIAFAHFFRRIKEKKAGKNIKAGFPRFKSKHNGTGSFHLRGVIRVFEKAIRLPRLGSLRLKEHGYLPTSGVRILSATVSEKAGRWFVSLQVEMEIPDPAPEQKPVAGVDLGIAHMAVVSDGIAFENPRALKTALRKLKRLQRAVSRKQKGSANRKKAVRKLARAYLRVENIRKDALHKATSLLAKTKSVIVLEDLNVSGLLKNHRLAQAIADVSMYEFRRQLEYKGLWYGCQILFADRFYPSSKRCSQCGHVKAALGLKERAYHCDSCGMVLDRDLNAAINLEQLLSQS